MTKDIEREAFEKALAGNNIHNLKVCTIFDDEKNEYFASDVCDPSEDHIVESINLSWRMWQAAKALEAEKLKGCVVVPVEPTDAWMANYIDSGVEKYCEQFIGQRFAVTEKEKPSIKEEWRNPVRKAHALVLKVVEAARGGNE